MALPQKARSAARAVLAAASALVLTAAAFLYTPVALEASQQGPGMAIRTRLIVAVLMLSALSNWMQAVRPKKRIVQLAINASSGFNLIWIFSFVGPPVVLASLLGAALATVPAPRRFILILIGVAAAGLGLGLLLLRLTEPPGEHIFG
jgi:hypothetical protein